METKNTTSIKEEIDSLKPWFHNLHLINGLQTYPGHFLGDFPSFKWKEIAPHIPENLSGIKVLDIGCNAGFYSFELANRGADVLGIDVDEHYLRQAKWAAGVMGLQHKTEFRQMQVYDLANTQEEFDIVWFMGVLYHLRYPMLAMDIISRKCSDTLVFQTLTMPGKKNTSLNTEDRHINDRDDLLKEEWPKMAFIEKKFAGDPTNWWLLNAEGVESMIRSIGFKVTKRPGHEIYICKKDPENVSCLDTWNLSEYLSATQNDWKDAAAEKTKKQ
jgi:tRNA (mo5U34)-methyltransferase